MKRHNVTNAVILILCFTLGVVIGHRYIKPGAIPFLSSAQSGVGVAGDMRTLANITKPKEVADVDFGEFWDVWQILEKEYVDPSKLDRQEMVYGAIQGMTAAVGDDYTVFLPPEEDKRAAEELSGSFYGVGIELGYIDGILAVVAPLRGMPADKAGVKAGDLILRVKDSKTNFDQETNGWSLSEAVSRIRGEKGTQVQLTLLRPEEKAEPFELSIPRDEIIIPSVELEFVEHNGQRAAHLILSRFSDRTESEWNDAVAKILAEGSAVDLVVLDMRNNPGGYFDQAISVASEFVSKGTVVSQQGRYSSKPFPATGKPRLDDLPLVVLVNRGSASASEIVAGALRDLEGTKLVGETTFGKGTVQDRRQLPAGGGLHVTVAKWLLPSGTPISKEGINVDVEATDDPETEPDEVVQKAIEAAVTQ